MTKAVDEGVLRMFGLVAPCRHSLGAELHEVWRAHLCGTCLALRDGAGHAARAAVNHDGVVVSVLVAAQSSGAVGTRTAGPCVLRGLRRAEVVRADEPSVRLAAGVSLLLAGGTVRDHVADGDVPAPVRPAADLLGRRWERHGHRTLAGLGGTPAALLDVTAAQAEAEAGPHGHRGAGVRRVTDATVPTERAVAAALARTAEVAGRPADAPVLAEVGRHVGRVAHLVDAVGDLAADTRHGRWNPLAATGTDPVEAAALIGGSLGAVREGLTEMGLVARARGEGPLVAARLAERLLGHVLPRRVTTVLAPAGPDVLAALGPGPGPHPHGAWVGGPGAHGPASKPHRRRRRRCDCDCGCDCCTCDCCDCGCGRCDCCSCD